MNLEFIFETNVINIIILLGGLIYILSRALSDNLTERQQTILGAIQESEERLNEASKRLYESQVQLAQAQIVIDSIQIEAETAAKQVKNALLTDGKIEIERLTASAKSQISTIEVKVRKQISEYVAALALKRITSQLESKLTFPLQQQIIDRNILKLNE